METLKKYFTELTDVQIEQFSKLKQLYSSWNEKINVISRKDIESLYERHVIHSLAIAKFIPFKPNTEILDLGTGGGFPGIPLAIFFPQSNFTLIDSIGKKITVVNSIIEAIGLRNAKGIHKHSNELKGNFDFVVSRAVTSFSKFHTLVKGKINKESKNSIKNGIIYLKGGELSDELKGYEKKVILTTISQYFTEDFFRTKYIVYYPL